MNLLFPGAAKDENGATPLGNGHVGLWAYRAGEKETIHLNECTFWSGGPKDAPDCDFYNRILSSRKLLLAGKFKEGEKAMLQGGKRIDSEEYDPIGDLLITTPGEETCGASLDLSTAVLTVKNKIFSREYFVSYPDKVFVIRMKASKKAKSAFGFLNKNKGETEITDKNITAYGNAIHDGMAFCLYLSVLSDGQGKKNGHPRLRSSSGICLCKWVRPEWLRRTSNGKTPSG